MKRELKEEVDKVTAELTSKLHKVEAEMTDYALRLIREMDKNIKLKKELDRLQTQRNELVKKVAAADKS